MYRKAEDRDRPRKLAPIVVESPKPPRRGLERKAGRLMKNEPKDALQKRFCIRFFIAMNYYGNSFKFLIGHLDLRALFYNM